MRREATADPLGPGETDIVHLEGVPIEQVHSSQSQHAGELILVTAFVVVIAEYRDDGDADMFKHVEAHAHFYGHSVICKIAGDHQRIGKFVHQGKFSDILFAIFGGEMYIGYGSQPHGSLLRDSSTCSGCG